MIGDVSAKQPVNCACGAPAVIEYRPELRGKQKWAARCTAHGCSATKRMYGRTREGARTSWARAVADQLDITYIEDDSHTEPACGRCGLHGEHVCLAGNAWRSPEGRGADRFAPHVEPLKSKKPLTRSVLHLVRNKRAA